MDRPKVEIEKPGKGFSRVTVTFTEDARTTALNCAARLRRAASMAHGNPPQGVDPGVLDFEAGVLERLADRLAPGDIAALRGALVKTLDAFKSGAIRTEWNDPDSWKHDDELWYLKNDIESALSAPPRNCDVGNAADQARRFLDFCNAHRAADTSCMKTCPGYTAHTIQRCQAIWAQMPHEEGGKA